MSAIKYVSSLKEFLAKTEFSSENAIFRLQYQFTVAFLIGASMLLSASEFFGNPIDCITSAPKNVINTFCWISSTFTIIDFYYREKGIQAAEPGVFTPEGYDLEDIENKWRFHNYYQWVVFFLFFMAMFTYIPKFIWNFCEGGLMEAIGKGMKRGLYKEEDIADRKRSVVEYITTHIRLHNGYVYKYWFCEFLSLIIIITQMFIIDRFLGGEFMQYGTKVLALSDRDQEERVDPMIFVFPRMTKCNFYTFGTSGTIQRHDNFCILPLNILNEKTFIFIWFWYILLASMLGALVLYRVFLLVVPGLRPRVMHQHNKAVPIEALTTFCNKTSIGDWWILYVLSKNIDPYIYRDIVTRLSKEIETNAINHDYKNPGREGLHAATSV